VGDVGNLICRWGLLDCNFIPYYIVMVFILSSYGLFSCLFLVPLQGKMHRCSWVKIHSPIVQLLKTIMLWSVPSTCTMTTFAASLESLACSRKTNRPVTKHLVYHRSPIYSFLVLCLWCPKRELLESHL
jgi:hypothetical protein